jgi:hypothetical protein
MKQTQSPEYPSHRSHDNDGPSPDMLPTEARQGVKGHNVRYVLMISLAGAVIAMVVAYLLFFPR